MFARFRYNDLKVAARDCGGRGPYANSMEGRLGVEVRRSCAAKRKGQRRVGWSWQKSKMTAHGDMEKREEEISSAAKGRTTNGAEVHRVSEP